VPPQAALAANSQADARRQRVLDRLMALADTVAAELQVGASPFFIGFLISFHQFFHRSGFDLFSRF
jgi:hypothetical protein